jgi:acyl-CoA synthetase (AMP-forming)/AMP-acid ligase II/outer membrane protein assembly factor BamB
MTFPAVVSRREEAKKQPAFIAPTTNLDMPPRQNDTTAVDDDATTTSLWALFQGICFTHGDADAIQLASGESLCYLELEELSTVLASQLYHRYRPSVVLIDVYGHVVAETVAILACLQLGVPFCPVSVHDQHAGAGRLDAVVQALRQAPSSTEGDNLVAICGAADDHDPALGVFYQAGVHMITYLDRLGNLGQQIAVPRFAAARASIRDELYILFTSGTSSGQPKAVVGSQQSTIRRLQWFRDNFSASPRIARRTRLTFVDSLTELLGALLQPKESLLVAVEPTDLRDQGLAAVLDLQPTQITLLPSQLALVLSLPPSTYASLERVIVSGEPCPVALLECFRDKLPGRQLINLYGQTESTGDVLAAILTDLSNEQAVQQGVVAVGRPIISSIQVRLDGTAQEMFVRGNLAKGYLGGPVFDEIATGDTGFCKDGIWYIQGRCDDVAKVNGVLTNPSEVEAAVSKVYKKSLQNAAALILDGCVYLVYEKHDELSLELSRERMHTAGIPWNLIPSRTFLHTVPVSSTGAGKVDRKALRTLVKRLVARPVGDAILSDPSPPPGPPSLESMVREVLGLDSVDCTKSFVELGGDSASSIHLLYCLRESKLVSSPNFSAVDILEADSLEEMHSLLLNDQKSQGYKRLRVRAPTKKPVVSFSPPPVERRSPSHTAVSFLACVDARASAVSGKDTFYLACQGGLVQHLEVTTGQVLEHRIFTGWKFEAECVVSEKGIVILSAHNEEDKGTVFAVTSDLQKVLWQHLLDTGVRRVPLLHTCAGRDELWVRAGCDLFILDPATGETLQTMTVTGESYGGPVLDTQRQRVYYPGVTLVSVDFSTTDHTIKEYTEWGDAVGPCQKDALLLGESLILPDSWGQIHVLGLDNEAAPTRHTVQASSYPLSSPVALDQSTFLVGSYDGGLFCFKVVQGEDESSVQQQWQVDLNAAIYCRPLVLPDASSLVCTTAGDVVRLDQVGKQIWRTALSAEIWGAPQLIATQNGTFYVALGARDSKVHILRLCWYDPQVIDLLTGLPSVLPLAMPDCRSDLPCGNGSVVFLQRNILRHQPGQGRGEKHPSSQPAVYVHNLCQEGRITTHQVSASSCACPFCHCPMVRDTHGCNETKRGSMLHNLTHTSPFSFLSMPSTPKKASGFISQRCSHIGILWPPELLTRWVTTAEHTVSLTCSQNSHDSPSLSFFFPCSCTLPWPNPPNHRNPERSSVLLGKPKS